VTVDCLSPAPSLDARCCRSDAGTGPSARAPEARIPVTIARDEYDAVLFYTDGATEARNSAGVFLPLASCASVSNPVSYDRTATSEQT
jgi:hypothetical protein